MQRLTVAVGLVVAVAALTGCNRGGTAGSSASASAPKGSASAAKGAASAPVLLVSAEDVATVQLASRAQGPVITGSIQPEKRADLRAEIVGGGACRC